MEIHSACAVWINEVPVRPYMVNIDNVQHTFDLNKLNLFIPATEFGSGHSIFVTTLAQRRFLFCFSNGSESQQMQQKLVAIYRHEHRVVVHITVWPESFEF